MDKYRYFIHLAYNGSRYLGWQTQKQTPTVQQTINEACSAIFRQQINVVGCGRTDTGVHARDFYLHLDLNTKINPGDTHEFLRKLNRFLPRDIVLYDILAVSTGANARFDAISRTYKYEVLRSKDPFRFATAYAYFSDLDVEAMNRSASILLEYEDFTSFSKVNTQVKTNNCNIIEAKWEESGNILIFTIRANRFLRNMVRAIVGTLLDVGKGKIDSDGFRSIIEQKDRSKAGYSVPAHGLYLHKVEYPEPLFL